MIEILQLVIWLNEHDTLTKYCFQTYDNDNCFVYGSNRQYPTAAFTFKSSSFDYAQSSVASVLKDLLNRKELVESGKHIVDVEMVTVTIPKSLAENCKLV